MAIKALNYLTAWQFRPATKISELGYELIMPSKADSTVKKVIEKAAKILAIALLFPFALVLTHTSLVSRAITNLINGREFMSDENKEGVKTKLTDGSLSLITWNVCNISGGFPYDKGGVTPWRERLERVADKVILENADVVCLQEMHDNEASMRMIERLKSAGYRYFYYNIGAQVFGANSGLFVASKFKVDEPKFVEYSDHIDRTDSKFTKKGFFHFTASIGDQSIAHLYTTHTQHSDDDLAPHIDEIHVREAQMRQMSESMGEERGAQAIALGDFNMEPLEYTHFHQGIGPFRNPLLDALKGKGKEAPKTCFKKELVEQRWHTPGSANATVDYLLYLDSEVKDKEVKRTFEGVRTSNVSIEVVTKGILYPEDAVGDAAVPNSDLALSDHVALKATVPIDLR